MIYIHVPFCRSFCTYCDFYSEIAPKKECGSTEAFVDAVLEEAESRKEELSSPSPVNTLYIGGGTPSVLPLDVLSRLVQGVSSYINSPFGEFTIEVNPEDIVEKGEGYVRGLVQLGVSRVSMGIQSFDDGILKWMNRRHDTARAVEAFGLLRSGGIRNISVDLIFGLSQLSDETWIQTIEKTLALEPEHISAYQLSIEEGSALGELVVKGKYSEAGEDLCRRQYDILCSRLKAAGYHHYEISNFAKPGYEAVHNSAYWRRVPYIGLGPGAHSLSSGNIRSWNSQTLPRRRQDGRLATYSREEEVLSPEDIRIERIMLPLRTDEGIDADELYSLSDISTVRTLLEEGALEEYGTRIRIPEDHFFTSDEIIRELI